MDEKTIGLLVKPFEKHQLKKRQGGRKELTYVDGAVVIERINQVFGHVWTWEILDWIIDPAPAAKNGKEQHDVTVRGRLTVRDGDQVIVKEAFGGVRVGPFGAGECRGDDLKGAATDALKKAASLLGIGLDLYTEVTLQGEEEAQAAASQQKTQQKPPASKPPAQKGGAAAATQKTPTPLSGEQSAKITTLLRDTGMPEDILAEKVKNKYGCKVSSLNVEQAAAVITYLEGVREKGKAA